jgi:low temperature requirement protein LtrA
MGRRALARRRDTHVALASETRAAESSPPMTAPTPEKLAAVSSIELFFDLVFVFVITQVTQLVEHAHGAMDFLRALLVLVPIWWM